jgi:hypothetical protein
MLLEAELIVKRATLGWLAQRHPHGTHQEVATTLQMSRSWVSRVAAPPAPGRSPGYHGPAFPNACTPHAACLHCITTGRCPTHPGDPHRPARGPAAHPRPRSHPVLLAARSDAEKRWGAPATLPDTDLEDLASVGLYCPGSSPQAQATGAAAPRRGSPARSQRCQ